MCVICPIMMTVIFFSFVFHCLPFLGSRGWYISCLLRSNDFWMYMLIYCILLNVGCFSLSRMIIFAHGVRVNHLIKVRFCYYFFVVWLKIKILTNAFLFQNNSETMSLLSSHSSNDCYEKGAEVDLQPNCFTSMTFASFY